MAKYIRMHPQQYHISSPDNQPPDPWFDDPPRLPHEAHLFPPLVFPKPPPTVDYRTTIKVAEAIRNIEKQRAEDMLALSTDPYPREASSPAALAGAATEPFVPWWEDPGVTAQEWPYPPTPTQPQAGPIDNDIDPQGEDIIAQMSQEVEEEASRRAANPFGDQFAAGGLEDRIEQAMAEQPDPFDEQQRMLNQQMQQMQQMMDQSDPWALGPG